MTIALAAIAGFILGVAATFAFIAWWVAGMIDEWRARGW